MTPLTRGNSSPRSRTVRPQVVIIEEGPVSSVTLRGALSGSLGCDVTHVDLAHADAEVLETVDLIVIDHVIRDVDSIALCKAVRAVAQNVPICFCTPCDSPEMAARARHAGADDILIKPIALAALRFRLAPLLSCARNNAVTKVMQEVETMRREHGDVLTLLAHDLRGPMTVLSSALSYLQDELISEDGQELLRECRDAMRRMLCMADNMTLLGNIDAVAHTEDLIDLGVLIAEVSTKMQEAFGLQGLKIALNIEAGATIAGSDRLVRSLLNNMLGQASDQSPLGGVITVCVSTSESGVVLSVTDQGIDIAPEHREWVTRPEQTKKLKQAGVRLGRGMGMVVIHQIVQQLGGRLALSTPGDRGLTVSATFPVVKRQGSDTTTSV